MSDNADGLAARFLHTVITDGQAPPEDIDPARCGKWRDPIEGIRDACRQSGTGGARGAFGVLVKQIPGLANLLSGEADTWQVYTLEDAYAPRDPPRYAVDGLLEMPSLSAFYGAPGALKSMLLADMAICVASGLPWLEPLPGSGIEMGFRTVQVPVLWLDFDNGLRRTLERFDALGQARKLPETTPLYFASMPSPWLDAGNLDHILRLEARIKARGVGLVIVDNLCVVSGDAEENSPDMAPVMSNFRQLVETCGVAVDIVHHQRKSNGLDTRKGETLRGHSSIEAALDLAVLVEREDGSNTVIMKATKVRGAEVSPFGGLFTYEHREGTKELAEARFFGVANDDPNSDRAIENTIREVVSGQRNIKKTELTNAVRVLHDKAGVNRIRNLIEQMAGSGKLVCSGGDNNAKQYDLPQA